MIINLNTYFDLGSQGDYDKGIVITNKKNKSELFQGMMRKR
jgi:hypothetical protein